MPQYFEGQGDFIGTLYLETALLYAEQDIKDRWMVSQELSMGYSFEMCGFATLREEMIMTDRFKDCEWNRGRCFVISYFTTEDRKQRAVGGQRTM